MNLKITRLKMISIKVYLYPILSVISFMLISFYPLITIILFIISSVFLAIYLSADDRTKLSDIIVIFLYILALTYSKLVLIYILGIFFPMLIFYYFAKKTSKTTFYIPVITPPLLLSLLSALLIFFVPQIYSELYNNILQFITDLTEPAKNSMERFSDSGLFVYMINNKDKAATNFIELMPATIYSFSLLTIFFVNKMRPSFIDEGQVYRFRLPDFFVWVFILFAGLFLIQEPTVHLISKNILTICAFLYFLQGFELFDIFFNKVKLSKLIKVLIILIIFTKPSIILFVAGVGMLNIWVKPKIFIDEDEVNNGLSK